MRTRGQTYGLTAATERPARRKSSRRFPPFFMNKSEYRSLLICLTMNQTKKKKGLARLFEIAGQKKGLLALAGVLSAGSAVCMLVPYWAVYEILKELLTHGGSPASADGAGMVRWGWTALGGLAGGLVLLYAALMSSHVAAFRILCGLRVRLSEHIGRLPLGYLNNTSTGAIKKTMDQNIEKIEGFIAHTIPDLVNVAATVTVMIVIFFSLDIWLTVVCLAVVAVSLFLQFSNFMGKKAREFMGIYYDAQEKMSASAVQYVRGMPVVKIFGQSVLSFRQFNAEIQAYKTFALKCCDTYQNGMVAFTVLLNSMVTFILPMGILLMQASPQSLPLAVVWLFFIIMGPGMASPVYKLTFLGGVPFSTTKNLFQRRKMDECENRILALSRQALLSTAELVKCVELGIFDLSSGERVIDALYDDVDTTSDNIRYLMLSADSRASVTLAVANLCLGKQIIFERV